MDNSRHGTTALADRADDVADDPDLLAERLLDVVSASMRRVRMEMRRHSAPELTVPQFRALRYVQRHPGSDLTGLASHLGMSASSASALVERLQRAGHVRRTTDPDERRRMRLALSPSGTAAVARAVRGTRTWLSRELDAFGMDERRRLGEGLRLLARIGDGADDETDR